MAEAHRADGNIEAARGDYVRVVSSSRDLPSDLWPDLVLGLLDCDPTDAAVSALADALDDAVEEWSDEPELYVARGEMYRSRGLLENAVNEYSYAVELDEECQRAWLGGAACLLGLGRPGEAATGLDHAADLDPNEVRLFARLGDAWLDAGQPTRAIAAYEEGLELDQRDPALYRGRATASLEIQLYESAEEDVRSLLQLTNGDTSGEDWWLLARALYGQARDTDAIEALDRCITEGLENAEVFRTRGDSYFALGDWENARADYARALQLDPTDAEAQLSLAEVHLERGEYEDAAHESEALIEAHPELVDAYVAAARARNELGESSASKLLLERAIESDAGLPDLYVERAMLHIAGSRPYLAWRDLRWALDLDAEYAYAYVVRAQLALEMEGPEEALADLSAAIEIDPQYGTAYAWRGRALQLADRQAEATRDWDEAEDLLPADHPLRERIITWRGGD
jgi:tetratricopeptide (TPR) repeat protein